ncbi:MAG: hypothetical protein QM765_25100 [Myxococcales bacterium]
MRSPVSSMSRMAAARADSAFAPLSTSWWSTSSSLRLVETAWAARSIAATCWSRSRNRVTTARVRCTAEKATRAKKASCAAR